MHKINKVKKMKNVDPLTTTRWSQEFPYNYQLALPGETIPKTPVGCVGVAGGQIMAFHKHPESAQGVIIDSSSGINLDVNDFHYEWDKMKDSIASNSSQENIDAISTLLYHCNLAAQTSGAAGNSDKLFESFVENFKYDSNIEFVSLKFLFEHGERISFEELQSIIKNEIDLGRPVFMSIPGHAVVCDGYREDDFFSFNYGWGERLHRWYKLDNSKEGCVPVSAYTKIRPSIEKKLSINYFICDEKDFYPNQSSTARVSIKNIANEVTEGSIRLCLRDSNNALRTFLTSSTPLKINCGEEVEFNIDFTIPNDASKGIRYFSIEFENASNESYPVKNESLETGLFEVKISPKTSSSLKILEHKLPDKVESDDSFNVVTKFTCSVDGMFLIDYYFSDDFYNTYLKLGSTTIEINEGQSVSKSVPLYFTTNETEFNHKIIVVATKISDINGSAQELIPFNDGALYYETYVKNKTLGYSEKIYLESILDKSNVFYAAGRHRLDFKVRLSDDIKIPHNEVITISIRDEDNNILSYTQELAQFVDDTRVANISGELKMPNLSIDESQPEGEFLVTVSHVIEDESLLLSPDKTEVKNPDKLIVKYRNHYDCIYIYSDLEVQSHNVSNGENFDLDFSMALIAPNFWSSAVLFTIVACLMNDKGEVFEIGEALAAAPANFPYNGIVNCYLPKDLPLGEYKLFLKGKDMSSETGPARNKISGWNSDIIDCLDIEVI